jgi:RNA polymerase sigma-70 factor (ECF subfamily)
LHTDDEELAARLKSGESEAWGELYARYRRRIYRFALKLTQDRDLAEDIVQETFLKMQSRIRSLGESHSLASWLFTIARNEVYSHLRRTRRNGQQQDADEMWTAESTLDQLVSAETSEIVQRHIAQLKVEYREVLLLREYEELSYAEISLVTGDPEATVKWRLFKARRALAKKLKPMFGMEK